MNTKTRKPRTTGTQTRGRKRWTPYTNKRLIQMKEGGMTYGQIAKKLKRSQSSVTQQVRILGLSKTRNHKPRLWVGDTWVDEAFKIKHDQSKAEQVGKQWTNMGDRLKRLDLIEQLLKSPRESELIVENIRLKKENADLRSLLKSVQTRVASVFEEVGE